MPGSDSEVHTLGQRQLAGVVDGVGRTTHVGPPRVRPGLAAAAGLLLAAEGATDLRTRRADVDVDDAAVRTLGGQELLGLCLVAGEDAGREALRDSVVQRNR